ncbi:serine/arginine repetitive matrix protein 1-like isoform X1 [Nylanderia fulva]|uniref:serine/arginine repetitive matrix protein 1-like isoform X1 n=1 Tax=Nylanderia fulva TaxID=613905 RepID=UPI0010FAD1ED|nr:serine/arginine repetitive matrix protein 1-like isoform X1 [Nylanderia fulva]
MQLATSQRPHPPPVPPRPSRQVVAEALKRSPRPPCPTRQAPPPPNMKPWRSNQQQQPQQQTQQQQVDPATTGRTIVYESIREDCKDESASDDRDRKQARNTDRNVEDNRPENGGKIASSHEHHENISSGRLHPTGNIPVNVVRKRNSLTEDQRPQQRLETRGNSRGKDPVGLLDYRGRCRALPGKDQLKENATERVEVARTVNMSLEDRPRASFSSPDSAGGQVMVSHPEKCNGSPEREADDERVRSTPTCKPCPGEQQHRQKQHPEIVSKGKTAGNDSVEAVSSIERSTSVPSVDRAATTVLVIDEPERKIALSDHEDNNDDDDDEDDGDNNIHRQDWLEAGVHYSSTQITLHGDDIVDGDHRINGYDHREEERITDLDFISIQERIAMSSLQGLPPLPRSLSGFNLSGRGENGEPPPPPTRSSSKSQRGGKPSSSRPSPPARQLTTLDTQLAVLRREMFGLRQLDLSLLSQLWSLNESIQEFRQLLQEQEDRAPSPSPSSEEGDDTSYGTHPPPPPRRPAPTLHHHRPPRPPRPPRPSASDESPSSEECGAV